MPENSSRGDQPFDLIQCIGITGIEIGNWVRNEEGRTLQRLLSQAFLDLEAILGNWTSSMCRRGNLAIGIGARGSGGSCAHYEPELRVINLTKKNGDGSLVHEFAHFLDHMLAEACPSGQSRFLSQRVLATKDVQDPIAGAMKTVMDAITMTMCSDVVTGDVRASRWYRKSWLQRHGLSVSMSPQEAYDLIANRASIIFQRSRNAGENSRRLVHSLAKCFDSAVEVKIRYFRESDFLKNAKEMGEYWKRPWELFARAFEAYLEDLLSERGWINEYLVTGTKRDYSAYRGSPYPVGTERQLIAVQLDRLIHSIRG